jgi:hypothetical protein
VFEIHFLETSFGRTTFCAEKKIMMMMIGPVARSYCVKGHYRDQFSGEKIFPMAKPGDVENRFRHFSQILGRVGRDRGSNSAGPPGTDKGFTL